MVLCKYIVICYSRENHLITCWSTIMDVSTAKELIGLLSERASAWQALWTVFYTVSAAIVTLIASGKLLPKYRRVASTVAVAGFLLFATGNYKALNELRKQREAVVEFVKDKAKDTPHIIAVAEASAPPSHSELRIYHWGLCIFVVVLLCAIPAFQKAPEDTQQDISADAKKRSS